MKLNVLLSIFLCTFQFHILGAQQISLQLNIYSVLSAVTDTALNSCVISDQNYTFFKPGEAIVVRIVPDSTSFLNGIYKIDENGYIEFPIIGNFLVANLTKTEFIDKIKTSCLDYIHHPIIEVKSLIRISLLGGFFKPGLYWVDSKSSLWDVIRSAGGVTHDNSLKKIRWERNGQVISKNIIPQFQSGQSLKSIGIESGDQLCVPDKASPAFTFRDDFLPVFTLILSTITTGITLYQTYRLSKD